MAGTEAGTSPALAPADPASGQPAGGQDAWRALEADEVLARLGDGPGGLADAERARRLVGCGPNLPAGARRPEPWWVELGESVPEPLQLLLIALVVVVLLAACGVRRAAGRDRDRRGSSRRSRSPRR
jgi:Cation transporter/ATPase, N-terminus